MPHDSHGNELKVGDIVSVPCKVKAIHLTEEYCNIDLETSRRMWPSDQPTTLTLNSRQVDGPSRGLEDSKVELLRGARVFLDILSKASLSSVDAHTKLTVLREKIDAELVGL